MALQVQYTTRDLSEIKADAGKISKNLSPLVGCKVGNELWAPFTAVNVCKAINVAGLECSNVSSEFHRDGLVSYKFTSQLTTEAIAFWRKVLEYSTDVLNSSYTMYIQTIIPRGAEITEKLKLTSEYCIYTDSTIFDAAYGNDRIKLSQSYARICHILLSCYTLRYFLTKYAADPQAALNTMEVNETVIRRTIENINYTKMVLAEDFQVEEKYMRSVSYCRQHLTTLRKNLEMIRPFILQYITG